jgi:hypothetical protein
MSIMNPNIADQVVTKSGRASKPSLKRQATQVSKQPKKQPTAPPPPQHQPSVVSVDNNDDSTPSLKSNEEIEDQESSDTELSKHW